MPPREGAHPAAPSSNCSTTQWQACSANVAICSIPHTSSCVSQRIAGGSGGLHLAGLSPSSCKGETRARPPRPPSRSTASRLSINQKPRVPLERYQTLLITGCSIHCCPLLRNKNRSDGAASRAALAARTYFQCCLSITLWRQVDAWTVARQQRYWNLVVAEAQVSRDSMSVGIWTLPHSKYLVISSAHI